jgi:hypothetical protein
MYLPNTYVWKVQWKSGLVVTQHISAHEWSKSWQNGLSRLTMHPKFDLLGEWFFKSKVQAARTGSGLKTSGSGRALYLGHKGVFSKLGLLLNKQKVWPLGLVHNPCPVGHEPVLQAYIQAGWPDWANFRLSSGCLLWVFLRIWQKSLKIMAYFIPMYQICIYFNKKLVGLHFGRHVHKLIRSPSLQAATCLHANRANFKE